MATYLGMGPNLAATLIGTIVGTGAWLTGLAHRIWPANPMLCVFALTLAAAIAVLVFWPRAPRRNPGA